MVYGTAGNLVDQLRAIVIRSGETQLRDHDLLQHYTLTGDEAAFAVLLRRHSSMVLSVCRNVLRHEQDAEDALQATFLIFARKAGSIRNSQSVASWLYAVAYRTALTARRMIARQRRHDRLGKEPACEQPFAEASLRELQSILHKEVRRLPEKLRSAFVLCCLEGWSRTRAAQELGCGEAALASRLVQARLTLRQRLLKRGVSLTAALTALAVAHEAWSAPPAKLILSAVSALKFGGQLIVPAVAGVRPQVVAIAKAALPGSAFESMKWWLSGAIVAVALAAAGTGTLVLAKSRGGLPGESPMVEREQPALAAILPVPTDAHGDPLPPGSLARLGTVRFRHGLATTGLAYSPDGRLLASAGWGRGLCLWDNATGKLLHELVPAGAVWSVVFSPDGKLVVAGHENALHAWDTITGNEVQRMSDTKSNWGTMIAVAFSADGAKIASQGNDNWIRVWDAATGKKLRQLSGRASFMPCVAFSPDCRLLAAGAGDGVHVWEVATGKSHPVVSSRGTVVNQVAFSPDGQRLAYGGMDQIVRIWDLAASKELKALRTCAPYIFALAFSPDGQTLAAGLCKGQIQLWDTISGKELRQVQASAQPIRCLSFSPDGSTVATGSYEHSALRLWDPETGQEQHALPGPQGAIDFLSFSADGSSLFVGSKDHTLRRWDWTHGREATILRWDAGLVIDHLAISSDGPIKAAFYQEFEPQERALRVWGPHAHAKSRLLAKNVDLVRIALSPDGKQLIGVTQSAQQPGRPGAHKSRSICLWDVADGKELAKNSELDADVSSLAYSPDGKTFVTAHAKEGLRFWDAKTLKEWRRLPGNGDVDSLVFSPDGRLVAGVNKRALGLPVRLWEIATGKESSLPVKNGRALTFSPDSKLLGVGTSDPESALVLIDIADGKELHRFKGHHSGVLSVAFSPTNRFMATGGGDATVLLWKLTGGSTATARETKAPPADDPLTDSGEDAR